jgi:uncharacterized iron-regulated membrane protein
MKLNKKLFFRIHSWIGVKLSLIFFIVCLSGTLATLSNEMDWVFIPEIRAEKTETKASRNEIADQIQSQFPNGQITYWAAASAPYLCDIVYVQSGGVRNYVFVNPYTGQVQGSSRLTFQRYFRDLHYYLFIPFQVGHFMVLVFAFLLLVSTITAILFYKKWYRKLFVLQTGKGMLVFFRSLHRLVGVWSVPMALLFSVTGIWYFVERSNIGNVRQVVNPSTPQIDQAMDSVKYDSFSYAMNYDRVERMARKSIPGLIVKDILPPGNASSSIYVNGISDVPLVRNRANRVYLHPETYEVISVQKASAVSTTMWINDITDPIHFGYWGGLTTKILWFIFGVGISSLVASGLWISLKRQAKSARKIKPGKWKYLNYVIVSVFLIVMNYILLNKYQATIALVTAIDAGWLILGFLMWYIYVDQLKLNKPVVQRNKSKSSV